MSPPAAPPESIPSTPSAWNKQFQVPWWPTFTRSLNVGTSPISLRFRSELMSTREGFSPTRDLLSASASAFAFAFSFAFDFDLDFAFAFRSPGRPRPRDGELLARLALLLTLIFVGPVAASPTRSRVGVEAPPAGRASAACLDFDFDYLRLCLAIPP
jgi:hypothetical protein